MSATRATPLGRPKVAAHRQMRRAVADICARERAVRAAVFAVLVAVRVAVLVAALVAALVAVLVAVLGAGILAA